MEAENLIAPGWVTTAEAAQIADYTPTRVRQLAKAGRVSARKIGRDWLVKLESLMTYKAGVRPGRPRESTQ